MLLACFPSRLRFQVRIFCLFLNMLRAKFSYFRTACYAVISPWLWIALRRCARHYYPRVRPIFLSSFNHFQHRIISRGVEILIEAHPGKETPVTKMAFALLAGFAFMLLVEQAGSGGHGHDTDTYTLQTRPNAPSVNHVEFEANLDDLERNTEQQARQRTNAKPDQEPEELANGKRAFALTLGLCLHALTDGLALGVSAISDKGAADRESNLSFVVFIALIIHKGEFCIPLAIRPRLIYT
jgi:zinc transporter ZupT